MAQRGMVPSSMRMREPSRMKPVSGPGRRKSAMAG
jgi:hypothetical protein